MHQTKQTIKKLEIQNKALQINDKTDLVFLTLQLFLVARIGYRAVSRVLMVIAPYLGVSKTPCTQTIINWVNRLSLSRMKHYLAPIDDISHFIANLLKHEYQKHPQFETFIQTCGKVSKMFKQTIQACLAPPKVSTKARFMNIHRLVKWASQLLEHSSAGRARKNSMLEKLRQGFDQLPHCKVFITDFLQDVTPLTDCQKILKTKGLSSESVDEC